MDTRYVWVVLESCAMRNSAGTPSPADSRMKGLRLRYLSDSAGIIAERSMYWGAGTPLGEACHDSIGMDSAHTTFYLPDGQSSNGRETWTLVANPNGVPVDIQIDYLSAGGQSNQVVTDTIAPNSRKTFALKDKINGRASIVVTSRTAGAPIMVERSMYWNNRGAGTDTIGGYSD